MIRNFIIELQRFFPLFAKLRVWILERMLRAPPDVFNPLRRRFGARRAQGSSRCSAKRPWREPSSRGSLSLRPPSPRKPRSRTLSGEDHLSLSHAKLGAATSLELALQNATGVIDVLAMKSAAYQLAKRRRRASERRSPSQKSWCDSLWRLTRVSYTGRRRGGNR